MFGTWYYKKDRAQALQITAMFFKSMILSFYAKFLNTYWQFSRRKDQTKTDHWNEQLLKILVDKVLLIKSTKTSQTYSESGSYINKILKSIVNFDKILSQNIKF